MVENTIRSNVTGLPETPGVCSIIVVNYNGLRYLEECFASLLNMDYPADRLDIIMVDNGSEDGSVEYVKEHFPAIRIFRNPENSYCKAVNIGLREARGEYIGMLNNDTIVDRRWLIELVAILDQYPKAGAAGGKILFKGGLINSAGVEEMENGYFRDRGFEEKDRGQYDRIDEVLYLCGAGILYRRAALDEVGPFDTDFVIYFEDVDSCYRMRKQGWKLMYTHLAKIYHEFRGSSKANRVCYYFCNRNRLLYMAKHLPYQLAQGVKTSFAFRDKEYDMLYEFIPSVFKKLVESQDMAVLTQVVPNLVNELVDVFGTHKLENLMARLEVALGFRRIRVGIYDHALHFMGGGQKYVCTLGSLLQDRYDVTFISNKPVTLDAVSKWYDLDLSLCRLNVIPLEFYDSRNCNEINASMVTADMANPFIAISKESTEYDFFLNANMLAKCLPLSNRSILVCHFPDVDPGPHFAVHKYTHVITNSHYTTHWLRKRWGMDSDRILYPPVNMYYQSNNGSSPLHAKENIILSVSRFEQGGSKKQKELVKAFNKLCKRYPEAMKSWQLWLIGGAVHGNSYAEEVLQLAKPNSRIKIKLNLPLGDLRNAYVISRIFWHACGLDVDESKNPELIEHFGMTTVEAMQNYCAPVVINGGGQKEIVEHGKNGFLFNTLDELCDYTYQLIANSDQLLQTQMKAFERSHQFNQERFAREAMAFFDELEKEYASLENPSIDYVATTY